MSFSVLEVAGGSAPSSEDEDSFGNATLDGNCSIDFTGIKKRILGLVKRTSGIPEGFARMDTHIPHVRDRIHSFTWVCCVGGSIISPNNFFVNPLPNWNDLNGFMKRVQISYRRLLSGNTSIKPTLSVPKRKALLPGLPVVVWYKKEWNRARILKRFNDTTYTVRLIDFGDIKNVEMIDIRYLLKSLTDYPTQAVRCRLLVKNWKAEAGLKKDWNPQQCQLFLKMLFNRGLAIYFKESTVESGERIWNVNMKILQKGCSKLGGNQLLSQKDIEQALFDKLSDVCLKRLGWTAEDLVT